MITITMMVMKRKQEVPPNLGVLHLKTHWEFQAWAMREVVELKFV
jgi:hypothetical protein